MDGYFPILFCLLTAFGICLGSTTQLLRSGFTSDEQKKGIVSQHNELRNLVASGGVATQPEAQNMREIRWDEELEQKAQEWADKCIFEHDSNTVNQKRQPVGENIAQIVYHNTNKVNHPDIERMIKLWFDEVYEIGYNGTFTPEAGHYSQMIWGNTYKVGCGFSAYNLKGSIAHYLVCKYYPAGNIFGQLPYEYGSVDCPENFLFQSLRYGNLCTIDKELIYACSAQWTKASENERGFSTTEEESVEGTTSRT